MKTRTVETIAEEFGYDEHELTGIFEMVADIMELGAESLASQRRSESARPRCIRVQISDRVLVGRLSPCHRGHNQ